MQTIDDLRQNFEFVRACAGLAGVPFTEHWELAEETDKVWPWRIIDTAADATSSGDRVVFTLSTGNPRLELDSIGRAFRAIADLGKYGTTTDFSCQARRRQANEEKLKNLVTYTVLGAWEDGKPVPFGSLPGRHPVADWDQDELPEGIWSVSVDATDQADAVRLAVLEMSITREAGK